mgnify:CR=1 FL=1
MTGSKEDMGVSDMKAEHVTTNEDFDNMGDSFDFPDPDIDPDYAPTRQYMPTGDVILSNGGSVGAALQSAEETDARIFARYREAIAAHSMASDRPPPGMSILAEIKSLAESFESRNLASPGNVILRALARAPPVQAYIRKRANPINTSIENISGRLKAAMEQAVSDAREAANIWGVHQQSITELTELIDVSRMHGGEIAEKINQEGETRGLIDARREIDRLLDAVESRVFLLNKDAYFLESHVLRCREQVADLRYCENYLGEMEHSINMICLSANEDRRSALVRDISAARERLEITSTRIARNAAIAAAHDRERGYISHSSLQQITKIRMNETKSVIQIGERGEKERRLRREAIARGYQIGIGASRDRALERYHSDKESS